MGEGCQRGGAIRACPSIVSKSVGCRGGHVGCAESSSRRESLGHLVAASGTHRADAEAVGSTSDAACDATRSMSEGVVCQRPSVLVIGARKRRGEHRQLRGDSTVGRHSAAGILVAGRHDERWVRRLTSRSSGPGARTASARSVSASIVRHLEVVHLAIRTTITGMKLPLQTLHSQRGRRGARSLWPPR